MNADFLASIQLSVINTVISVMLLNNENAVCFVRDSGSLVL